MHYYCRNKYSTRDIIRYARRTTESGHTVTSEGTISYNGEPRITLPELLEAVDGLLFEELV